MDLLFRHPRSAAPCRHIAHPLYRPLLRSRIAFSVRNHNGVASPAAFPQLGTIPSEHQSLFERDFRQVPSFITKDQEDSIVKIIEKKFSSQRLEYSMAHFDGVASGYREMTLSKLGPGLSVLRASLIRIVEEQGPSLPGREWLPLHVLDLLPSGQIAPHVDHLSYSGSTIATLSLLSDCILTFIQPTAAGREIHIKVQRRGVYIQTGSLRNEWKHAIEKTEWKEGNTEVGKRLRRISIILRSRVGS